MKKILEQINRADRIALYTHILPDGDAIGSLFAMGMCLKKLGKQVDLYINEKIPLRLEFLAQMANLDYYVQPAAESYDLCLSLDCGDTGRLGSYKDQFEAGAVTANVDHHVSNTAFAAYNYVDSAACSTGEIVYQLIMQLNVPWDKNMAGLVYAAIASDTGCFVFSNTNEKAHLYAADLLKHGAEVAQINKLLFNTNDLNSLRVRAYAIDHIEFYFKGKVAVVLLTKEILDSLDASDEDAEGLTDLPRSVRGVEVGIVVREWKGKTKVSLRTNQFIDASAIAAHFGGGGHVKAAGCTTELDVWQTRDQLIEILEELF